MVQVDEVYIACLIHNIHPARACTLKHAVIFSLRTQERSIYREFSVAF